MKKLMSVLIVLAASTSWSQDSCTSEKKKAVCKKEIVVENVEKACKILEEKGEAGIDEVRKLRFDCCGEPNYVWIQDSKPQVLMHPVAPKTEKDYSKEKEDSPVKTLVTDAAAAAKKNPKGGWFEYKWMKMGETEKSDKISFAKACKGKQDYIVGSGTWK